MNNVFFAISLQFAQQVILFVERVLIYQVFVAQEHTIDGILTARSFFLFDLNLLFLFTFLSFFLLSYRLLLLLILLLRRLTLIHGLGSLLGFHLELAPTLLVHREESHENVATLEYLGLLAVVDAKLFE